MNLPPLLIISTNLALDDMQNATDTAKVRILCPY